MRGAGSQRQGEARYVRCPPPDRPCVRAFSLALIMLPSVLRRGPGRCGCVLGVGAYSGPATWADVESDSFRPS